MNSRLPIPDLPETRDSAAHAIVIGSGFGGLAAAIRLGARGYRVTILEKLDAPGGRAYVHRRDGFTFDAGPTIITAPFLLEELWELCGRKFEDDIDLRHMDPYFQIRFDDGRTFNYSGDPERVRDEIRRFNPGDVAGYERYLKASEQRYKIGFERYGLSAFNTVADLLRAIPDLLGLRSDRSVYRMVSKYISDPQLRMAFSFHPLLIGGNPFAVTSVYTLISYLEQRWGVHSAMGGTGAIVDAMVDLLKGQGSRLRLNSPVEEIIVEKGEAKGVRLAGGEVLSADVVVSNADAAWTYRHLIPANKRKRWSDSRIDRAAYSNGLFVWYFGTTRRYEDVPHHSVLLGPRYKGLINDIFKAQRMTEDFSLYLHRPTATDPGMAPAGCDTFYALVPVPHLGSGTDWEANAEPFRQAVQKRLEETALPGLGDVIATSFCTTPLDFQDRLLSYRGAGFSFEPRLQQSAWFRPHNSSEDIRNLYLVGAGTHPGAGVPGVLSSARILDEVVPHASVIQ
ncbi:MAG: phytoene desaturase [Pseudomonadota bacterium]